MKYIAHRGLTDGPDSELENRPDQILESLANGYHCEIENEDYLKDDLLNKLGFKNYQSDIRPTGPGDSHANWIWVQVQK